MFLPLVYGMSVFITGVALYLLGYEWETAMTSETMAAIPFPD